MNSFYWLHLFVLLKHDVAYSSFLRSNFVQKVLKTTQGAIMFHWETCSFIIVTMVTVYLDSVLDEMLC